MIQSLLKLLIRDITTLTPIRIRFKLPGTRSAYQIE